MIHERYECVDCGITRHISELTDGCPNCGQTMTPAAPMVGGFDWPPGPPPRPRPASPSDRHLILNADARRVPLPDRSVQCVVTSPPYMGLRDYGIAGQIGLEGSIEGYLDAMRAVMREVWRVLRDDGTCWLNCGDSYAGGKTGRDDADRPNSQQLIDGLRGAFPKAEAATNGSRQRPVPAGLKPKDLMGIPWRLAFALQAEGWYLRSECIWSKPNPMPESVTDRPTKAHEQVFLLTKRERYFYDAEAVREPVQSGPSDIRKMIEGLPRIGGKHKDLDDPLSKASAATNIGQKRSVGDPSGRNLRSVWTIPTQPFPGAHFATMPRKLVEPCVKAGSSDRGACPHCGSPWRRVTERTPIRAIGVGYDNNLPKKRAREAMGLASKRSGLSASNSHNASTPQSPIIKTLGWQQSCPCPPAEPVPCIVFDPFGGAGTTVLVAEALGRVGIMTELNPDYCRMARGRITRPHRRVARKNEPLPLFARMEEPA